MAQPIPQALKIPEVSRFINRSNQLRNHDPAIAYWCEYRAINQIVSRRLHDGDPEATAYAGALMESLETTKAEHSTNEAIVDNDVARAYVEQFAQDIFGKAERAMRADKATRQTADTFDAAATFFELLREWGDLEPEWAQKIKFAKWNAARILKAIREGKDPNESNPKVQEDKEGGDEAAAGLGLDPNDPDVREITSGMSPQPANVQDVPDAGEPLPSVEPPKPSAPEDYFPAGPHPPAPVSPLSGGSPSVPTAPSAAPEGPPSVNSIPPGPSPTIPTKLPGVNSPTIPTKLPPDFTPPASLGSPALPSSYSQQPPPTVPTFAPQPAPVPAPAPVPIASHVPPPPVPVAAPPPTTAHYKDLNKAQKHAKFAISALNFEDVPTAVQELRNALASLGCQ